MEEKGWEMEMQRDLSLESSLVPIFSRSHLESIPFYSTNRLDQ